MRVQSTFEKITQGTNEQVFAVCLIALRIAIGLACLYFAGHVTSLAETLSLSASLPLYVVGLAFTLGIFVRPIALLVMAMCLVFVFQTHAENLAATIFTHLLVILGFSLFAAGGSGHALGLDGIISRNIRHPNILTKFLFG